MTDCAAVDYILEYLMGLINCNNDLILKAYEQKFIEKAQIQWFYGELQILQRFLINSEEKRRQNDQLKTLAERIRDVSDEIENVVDELIIRVVSLQKVPATRKPALLSRIKTIFQPKETRETVEEIRQVIGLRIRSVMEEMASIKTEVMEIPDKIDDIRARREKSSSRQVSSGGTNTRSEEEVMVGLEDETTAIKELLIGEHVQQLKVIPIVGMPGLGKTTLARKVYDDPLMVYHFYIRAWIYVSQSYQKRDLLLSILLSAFPITDKNEYYEMNDEQLGELLYKCLKGNRYLIVMDDMWSGGAWKDLELYFPNDNNGSRIMVTSRLVEVVLRAKPHHLRFLNEDESWDLFQKKVFHKENCPMNLMDIGKQIVKKCQGVPLAIVVIAGLLAKKDKTQDWWTHVAHNLSWYIASDLEEYMNTLALSYNHLPTHLKACFLYFAAFPEDFEIPVWKLICLWVAEGFIQRSEQKTLEEVAEDYLTDLIDRSLVIVSKKKLNGRIKMCHVHDLLRDLCLRKAQEENFLQHITECKDEQTMASSSSSSFVANKHRRLCIHSRLFPPLNIFYYICGICCSKLYVRTFLSFPNSHRYNAFSRFGSLISEAFTHLKVLNLSSTKMVSFPVEVTHLVLLRYLALHLLPKKHLLPSISNLRNLETFIVEGEHGSIVFSHDFWKMVKLKRLYAKLFIEIPCALSDGPDGYPFVLDNLQTMGNLCLCNGGEQTLKRTPNLKRLKCVIKKTRKTDHFPRLDSLIHLETLKVMSSESKSFFHPNRFPPNLRSLTFSNSSLSWDQMSTIGRLPKLEVLKLSVCAFEGARWDTGDGEFRKLKFLKFQRLDFKQWNASSNHFPSLQTLVIDSCFRLKEIPSGLGDICTLEMIELQHCNHSATKSVEQIQREQQSIGNDGLKVVIKNMQMEIKEWRLTTYQAALQCIKYSPS